MRFAASVLLMFGLTAGAGGLRAAPAEEIGSALVVVNLVTAALARDTRTLLAGDGVHRNEVIEVASDGSTEIKLRDDTKLALGPGARLTLDEFVYRGEKSAGAIAIGLAKGAFRFVTGLASKPSYVIRVPSASITVRGTIFDVFVETSGTSWLLLLEGSVRICKDRGACRIHSEPGKLIRISDDDGVGPAKRWSAFPRVQKIAFDEAFPFVVKAPSIDPHPEFTRDEIVAVIPPSGGQKDATQTPPETPKGDGGRRTGGKTGKGSYTAPRKSRNAETAKTILKGALVIAPLILGRGKDHDMGKGQMPPNRTYPKKDAMNLGLSGALGPRKKSSLMPKSF